MKSKLTIVVVTIPLQGHMNPMLGVVKGLARQGHTISVYSTPEFKKAIEEAGGVFKHAEGFQYLERFTPDVARDVLKITELILDMAEDQVDNVIEIMNREKADLVIHDGYCLWAKIAAHSLGIPAVSVITTIVFAPALLTSFIGVVWEQLAHVLSHPGTFWALLQRYNRLNRTFGIKSPSIFDMFVNEERLNIVFTSRYFQPKSRAIPKSYLFIGPSLSARTHLDEEKLDFPHKNPLIYISLGTIFNNDPQFYHICIDAFAHTPYNVLISVGKATDLKIFTGLPENIRVRTHVNQISVLKQAAVFVSHGGMNSVNESMYHGVPMVLFPAIQEQLINSLRVQQLGAGKVMQRQGLTKEILHRVVVKAITDDAYRKNAAEVQKSLRDAVGIPAAVKKMEELV